MKLFRVFAKLVDPRRPVDLKVMGAWALIIIVLDQLSKIWAVAELAGRPPRILIPGLLNFTYAQNPGAAWSILSDHTWLLALFSAVISVVLLVWAWRLKSEEQGLRLPLGLILGGAVGNLIDRVYLGYVVDFIDAHWFWKAHWPTFNIADSAVCVGMALLLIISYRMPNPDQKAG